MWPRDVSGPRSGPVEAPARGQKRVRGLLTIGFASVGFLHVLLASATKVIAIPLSAEFGLLQTLPLGYWFGMGLIGLALVLSLRDRSEALVVATGALLLATFAATPNLFEPNPRYWDSYLHFSGAQAALSSTGLPSALSGDYAGNWPGFFLFAASESAVSDMPALLLLTIHPFLAGGLTFLAIFVFLRSMFPRSVVGLGAVMASVFAVWAQYHVSPQSLGFVLLLTTLGLVWRRGLRWRLAGGIPFMALAVSHPTSTLVLLTILAGLSFFALIQGRRSTAAKDDARFLLGVTLLYGAFWAAWLFLHASGSSRAIEGAILSRMGELINLPDQTLNLATARTVQNLSPLPPVIRLAGLGLFGLVGVVSLVLLRRSRRRRRLRRFVVAGLLGIAFLACADVLVFRGQFYDRSLLFFATIVPALCLTGLKEVPFPKVRRAALVVLVVTTLMVASTTYYQEVFNEVRPETVAATDFLERIPSGGVVYGGMFLFPVWRDPDGRSPFSRVPFPETSLIPVEALAASQPVFVGFDRTAELWYRQWRGLETYRFYEGEVAGHLRIYDNQWAQSYLVRG